MRWTVHGERSLYDSDWVSLSLVDVELPDGKRFEHHVVRVPQEAAGTLVHDAERGVLLIWRHRFVTDVWGWEIPAGRIDAGEAPAAAAAREVLEETGWAPGPVTPLCRYEPAHGITDHVFNLFVADGATHVGDPVDGHEAERVEWIPVEELRALVRRGEMPDGLSLTAVLWAFSFGVL